MAQQEGTRNLPPVSQYPASLHASKLFAELFKAIPDDETVAVYLCGEDIKFRNDTDRELPFRQESNFFYLTGCDIPGSRLVCWSKRSSSQVTSVLLIPDLDNDDVMWSGLPLTPDEVAKELDVSQVKTVSDLDKIIQDIPCDTIQVLPTYSLPSASASGKAKTATDKNLLMAVQRARLIKTPVEIDLIQQANDISSRAHEGVMRALGTGDMKSEWEAGAIFSYHCARNRAKSLAYEIIAASGTSAGTLHYIKNKASFPSTGEGNLLLLDAGCEYNNYAADITRTFPIGNGGQFSPEAKAVYQLVEEMQDAAFTRIKPGCSWERLQILMHKTAAAGLVKMGIFKRPEHGLQHSVSATAGSGTQGGEELQRDDAREDRERNQLVQEIVASGITTAFFPHGLGHMLGLDVHDCPQASRPDGPGEDRLLRYLRYRGDLEEGHVITVEPGIYFNPFLLQPWKDSPYLDHEVLRKYMPVGGVRIEDDILVTKNGFHNFTTVKRSVEAIEALCQSAARK